MLKKSEIDGAFGDVIKRIEIAQRMEGLNSVYNLVWIVVIAEC
jgi:hypothetical protein